MDADDLAFLKERSMNVSEIVREAVHHRISVMRVKEATERMRQRRFKPIEPVEKTIRDLRDSR